MLLFAEVSFFPLKQKRLLYRATIRCLEEIDRPTTKQTNNQASNPRKRWKDLTIISFIEKKNMEPITIETNIGEFSVELYHQHAPKTCFNFSELVKIG